MTVEATRNYFGILYGKLPGSGVGPSIVDVANVEDRQETLPLPVVQRINEANKAAESIINNSSNLDNSMVGCELRLVPGVRLSEETLDFLEVAIPPLDSQRSEGDERVVLLPVELSRSEFPRILTLSSNHNQRRVVYRVNGYVCTQQYQEINSEGIWNTILECSSIDEFAEIVFNARNTRSVGGNGPGAA